MSVESEANAVYALGTSSGESARLQRQSEELLPVSNMLLDKAELRAGDHALDLGCGPRGVLELLAERVGPSGRVLGVDADPRHTAMAAELVEGMDLNWVETLTAEAADTGLPAESFDLVHTRTLLVTVPDPAAVIAEMVRLVKPGGWIVSLEPDNGSLWSHPPNAAFERLVEIFRSTFVRNGADPDFGRRIPGLFVDAGLQDIGVNTIGETYPSDHSRRPVLADLVQVMRPKVVELGIADETELDRVDAAVRTYLADPATITVTGLQCHVWGRKPR